MGIRRVQKNVPEKIRKIVRQFPTRSEYKNKVAQLQAEELVSLHRKRSKIKQLLFWASLLWKMEK